MEPEPKGQLEGFTTVKLTEINKILEDNMKEESFTFIADISGNVATFASYQAGTMLCLDYCDDVKKTIIAKSQSVEDSAEILRDKVRICMGGAKDVPVGKTLLINMDEMNAKADFYKHPSYPLESAFDPDFMKRGDGLKDGEATWKKLLAPGEDIDSDGNKGFFMMREGFSMAFVSNISDDVMDDEVITDVMANIPHIDKWKKYYVTK